MICDTCERDLGDHLIYCPENPRGSKDVVKWDKCMCYIHTCFDAKAKRMAMG